MGSEVEPWGLEAAPVWDVSIAGRSLTSCAMRPARGLCHAMESSIQAWGVWPVCVCVVCAVHVCMVHEVYTCMGCVYTHAVHRDRSQLGRVGSWGFTFAA